MTKRRAPAKGRHRRTKKEPIRIVHPRYVKDAKAREAFKDTIVDAVVAEVEAKRDRRGPPAPSRIVVVDPTELPPSPNTLARKVADVLTITRMAMKHPELPELRAQVDAMHEALVRLDAPGKMGGERRAFVAALRAVERSLRAQEVSERLAQDPPSRRQQLERALATMAEETRDSSFEALLSDDVVQLAGTYGPRGGRGVHGAPWLTALLIVSTQALGARRRDETLLDATNRVADEVRSAAKDLAKGER